MIKNVAIKDAKRLMKELGADGVIILTFDHSRFASASAGKNKSCCESMKCLLDRIADKVESGEWLIWGKKIKTGEFLSDIGLFL